MPNRFLHRYQEIFTEAKHGTIRNKFSKFVKENKIEFCYNDGIAFYTLAGKQFGKNKLMTSDHTDTTTIINYNKSSGLVNVISF
jgi:hypothetical protein